MTEEHVHLLGPGPLRVRKTDRHRTGEVPQRGAQHVAPDGWWPAHFLLKGTGHECLACSPSRGCLPAIVGQQATETSPGLPHGGGDTCTPASYEDSPGVGSKGSHPTTSAVSPVLRNQSLREAGMGVQRTLLHHSNTSSYQQSSQTLNLNFLRIW